MHYGGRGEGGEKPEVRLTQRGYLHVFTTMYTIIDVGESEGGADKVGIPTDVEAERLRGELLLVVIPRDRGHGIVLNLTHKYHCQAALLTTIGYKAQHSSDWQQQSISVHILYCNGELGCKPIIAFIQPLIAASTPTTATINTE